MEAGTHRGSVPLVWLITAILVLASGGHAITDEPTIAAESASGSGSGSGVSGSGSGMQGCVSACFTSCCVPNATESCVVNSGDIDMCSCDVGCFADDSCCFDILEVPCLPDIFVGFTPQNYTVSEGDAFVNVTVTASGFPGDTFGMVNVIVLLMTEDGTAEASIDFDGVIRQLVFSADGSWDVMIPIIDNAPIEATEFFTVGLTTINPFVVFNNSEATVAIIDNDNGTISLVGLQPTVRESEGTVEVCAEIENAELERDVVATIETIPGTATDPDDYSGGVFSITFESPSTRACINISIANDSVIEDNETFYIQVSSNDSAITPGIFSLVPCIILDDTVGTISLEGLQPTVLESEGTVEVCAEIENAELERDVVATIETIPGTATDPDDYSGGVFSITFESPSTRACINISIANDSVIEDNETFYIQVSSNDSAITPGIFSLVPCIILDDTVGTISLEGLQPTVLESEGTVEVCAEIENAELERDVVATIETIPGTATDPDDYSGGVFSITFESPSTRACINISIAMDSVFEDDETFYIQVSSNDSAIVPGFFSLVPCVILDESQIPFDFTQFFSFIPEAENNGFASVCVEVIGNLDREVIITLSTTDGEAVAPDDYTQTTVDLVFSATTSEVCAEISLEEDLVVEGPENIMVSLTSSDPDVVFVRDETEVVIIDTTLVEIGFEMVEYTVREDVGYLMVCLVQTTVPPVTFSRDVSLVIDTVPGMATAPTDYTAVLDEAIDFPTTNCTTIDIIDDLFTEPTEFFTVSLDSNDPAVVLGDDEAIVTILDDDDMVPIGIEFLNYTVGEGNSSVEVCVVAEGLLVQNVPFTLVSQDGSAVSGGDYVAVSENVVLSAGNDPVVCINVTIEDDIADEDDESFEIILTPSIPWPTLIDTTEVTVEDDDEVQIGFDQFRYVVTEGSDTNVTVCASLDRPLQRDGVIVEFSTIDGTALDGSDYINLTEIVTFNSGDVQMCVDIEILDDSEDENTEVFFVFLDGITGETVSSPLTIVFILDDDDDDQMVPIGIEFLTYTVGEGEGSVEVCVVADGLLTQNVPLFLLSQDGSAQSGGFDSDYGPVSSSLVLMAGFNTEICINVTIEDDEVDEDDENFFINLTLPNPWPTFRNMTEVTIEDNDEVQIGFDPVQYAVTEGVDPNVTVCASLDRPLQRDGVIVEFSTSDGSALSGLDYTSLTENVTFNSGDVRLCVYIDILDDSDVEQLETFFVNLNSVTGEPISPSMATVTILNDDPETLSFEEPAYSIVEGDFGPQNLNVCVVSDGVVATDGIDATVISFQFPGEAEEGVDYERVMETVTFNSGDTFQCINVVILGDVMVENNERFLLVLTSNDAETDQDGSIVTILDDDLVFEFDNQPLVFNESAGGVQVCVVLVSGAISQSTMLVIGSGQSGDTATAGVDYVSVTETLTFMPGDTEMCFTLVIINDEIVELPEFFTLTINSQPEATVTILANDPVELSFTQAIYIVSEGSMLVVSIEANRLFENRPFLVTIISMNDTAQAPLDYLAIDQDLIFPDTSSVIITALSDTLSEPNEQFILILSDTATGDTLSTATVIIENVDIPPPVFEFDNQPPLVFNEIAGGVQVCVVLVSGTISQSTMLVIGSGQFGDTATAGDDYVSVTETLIFMPGDTEMCFTLVIINDEIGENTEFFTLTINSQPEATVTILANDPVELSFTQAIYIVSEGSMLVVSIEANRLFENGPFLATIISMDDTAQAPLDYLAIDQDLIFPDTSSVIITALSDTLSEPNEQFILILSDTATGDTLSTATVIIENVDILFEFDDQPLVFDESAGGVEVCVVLVSGTFSQSIELVIGSGQFGDTATAGDDYVSVTETLTFMPGDTEMCFILVIIDDALVEGNEFFTLTINSQTAATVTIIDNDGAQIGLEMEVYSVSEEDGAARVCVSLSQPVDETVTATVTTVDNSALSGFDYIQLSTTLTFTGDDLRECVEVDLIDDEMGENAESFFILLQSNLPLFRSMATVNILADQDGLLVVTLQEPIVAVDEGKNMLPVCIDFVGTNLQREAVIMLTTITGSAQENVDYIGETAEITYFPTIVAVIVCENVTITDDQLEEEAEQFGLTLTSDDPAVTFLVSFGDVIIADNDNEDLTAGFVQTDIQVPETDGLTSARVRAFVNGRILQPVTLTITITGGTATEDVDYITAEGVLEFNSNSDNSLMDFYTILGDSMVEPDETIIFGLSASPSGVGLIQGRDVAIATIVNDDNIPDETGTIVLIDNTPEVISELDMSVSVRVMFMQSSDVFSVTCALQELIIVPQDCSSGEITFTGLPADRSPPLFLEITAFDQFGQQLAFITRPVRLGLNGDCAVNFLNGVEEAVVFQGEAHIEFAPVGPVMSTECRLDNGSFEQCVSPVTYSGLSVGEHEVKVRPNGPLCERRIRRTVDFTVV